MGLRELLILILILAIVAVILRGLYVALKARRGQLRMQLEKNIPQYDTEELLMSELPNGGARLVERSFAKVVKQNSELSARDRVRYGKGKGESAIPVLMDTVGDDEEEHEDEESVSAPRQSSVASAREAARQKHLQGQGFKPVHRPIDRLAAQAAGSTSPSISEPEEPEDDYEDFFEDPLDASPLSVEDDPLIDAAGNRHGFDDDASLDDEPEYFDENADDEDYEDDDYDDEAFDDEEEPDSDQAFHDKPFDDESDEDDDGQDDLDDEYEDEPEDSDDYDDTSNEEDWQDDEEPESWEDENDAEDEELDYADIAEEFDDVYGEPETDDEQDHEHDTEQDDEPDELLDGYDESNDGWDDEPEPQEAPVSAPRRWLKWAGKKFSGMGAAHEEPVRERDFHGHDRAEPVIGLDPVEEEESRPAAAPAPRVKEPHAKEKVPDAPRQARAPLDKSRQATLFDDEQTDADDGPEDDPLDAYEEPVAQEAAAAPAAHQERSRKDDAAQEAGAQEYSEVLVINVMAKPDREFAGVDLLPALLGLGLRFGDMNIFHRHVDSQSGSPVLFSVANMLNPGTFDLNQINDFATRGVCFFMTLPNVANSMQAFDRMLDAAQQLRMTLDGDLKDDVRSVMTAQTIEHYRQRVRDFDLRQLRQHK